MSIYGNYLIEIFGDNLAFYLEFKKLYDEAIKTNDEKKIKKAINFYKEHEYQINKSSKSKKAKELYNELLSKVKSNIKSFDKQKIKSTLKKIVDKYNKDSKIIQKLKELKASKFTCEIFEEGDNYISFIICDNDQEICIEISDIIYEIAKELEEDLNNPILKIDTGDGDEGCIYIKLIQ